MDYRSPRGVDALNSSVYSDRGAPRQRCDLRGALRAFSIICELTKAAQRDGWSNSGCASAIRSTAPTVRDVAAWRACDLVGIRDREAYLAALNNCSNGEIKRNPNFQSQMLMAFECGMGSLLGSFASNSSKDVRRRGQSQ
jgi:hypothetical protein